MVQVNTEENQPLAARYGIRTIPVLLLLRTGREVDRLAGAQPLAAIVSWFERNAAGS